MMELFANNVIYPVVTPDKITQEYGPSIKCPCDTTLIKTVENDSLTLTLQWTCENGTKRTIGFTSGLKSPTKFFGDEGGYHLKASSFEQIMDNSLGSIILYKDGAKLFIGNVMDITSNDFPGECE